MTTSGCDLCGDAAGELFLRARCHPTAPLRAVKDGASLTLRCYVPECDRVVAVLPLAEHPADDGEPVTADFAARHDGLSYTCTAGIEHHLRLVLDPRTGVWYYATVPVPLPTRGHVRRLLAALGVPTT